MTQKLASCMDVDLEMKLTYKKLTIIFNKHMNGLTIL